MEISVQIRHICYLESELFWTCQAKALFCLKANDDNDQTALMHKLMCVFLFAYTFKVHFLMAWPITVVIIIIIIIIIIMSLFKEETHS